MLMLGVSLPAQQSTTPAVGEKTLELEPFSVVTVKEQTYQASGSATASRYNQALKDIPQTISILNENFIRDVAAPDLRDALPYTGAYRQNNARSENEYIIRGFNVFVTYTDGVRDAQSWGSNDLSNVSQIEVIKGPSTGLYGVNFGIGGIINRVTKMPEKKAGYSLNATVGTNSFYRLTTDLTGPISSDGSWAYRLNAAYQDNDSFRDNMFLKRYFLAPVVTKEFNANSKLTLSAEFLEEETREDLGIIWVRDSAGTWMAPDVPRSRNYGEQWETSEVSKQVFRAVYTLKHSDTWSSRVTGQAHFIDNPIQQVESVSLAADNRTFNRQAFWLNRHEDTIALQLDTVGRFNTGPLAHTLLFGADFTGWDGRSNVRRVPLASIDIYQPVYVVTPPNFNVPAVTNTKFSNNDYAAYINDQISFARDRVQIMGGIRWDKYDQFSKAELATVTDLIVPTVYNAAPQYGILVRPLDAMTIYYSYGESFRPIGGGARRLDGSPLLPERGSNEEIGIKTAFFDSKLEVNVSAFKTTLDQGAIRLPPPNQSFFENSGSQQVDGAEVQIGVNLKNLNVLAGYTYADRYTTTPGLPQTGSNGIAKNLFNLFARYSFNDGALKGFAVGLGVIWVDDSRMVQSSPITLPGYTRLDALFQYRWAGRYSAQLNVGNVTDEDYWEGGGGLSARPGAPLGGKLSLNVRF